MWINELGNPHLDGEQSFGDVNGADVSVKKCHHLLKMRCISVDREFRLNDERPSHRKLHHSGLETLVTSVLIDTSPSSCLYSQAKSNAPAMSAQRIMNQMAENAKEKFTLMSSTGRGGRFEKRHSVTTVCTI